MNGDGYILDWRKYKRMLMCDGANELDADLEARSAHLEQFGMTVDAREALLAQSFANRYLERVRRSIVGEDDCLNDNYPEIK